MKNIILIFIATIIVMLNTCSDNPVNDNDNIAPGRRDYVWTVDTIPVQYAVMKDMWGSSPTDIWICGDADNRRESVWHYDGNNFTPSGEYILDPTSLWGASPNDIWLGTAASELWHYDGRNWKKFKSLTFPGYNDVVIQSICGTSSNNIYATGMANSLDDYRGIILHFNGEKWDYINLPYTKANFFEIDYDEMTNAYFIEAANFDHIGTPERLYLFKNNKVKMIYASEIGRYLGFIDTHIYMYQSNLQEIYEYINGDFKLFKNFNGSPFKWGLWGLSKKDFFCITSLNNLEQSGIGHYNGSDLVTIFETSLRFFRPILFNDEMLFLGFDADNFTQVIIKGKLNEK